MLISNNTQISFEKSRKGQRGMALPKERCLKADIDTRIPEELRRKKDAELPELSEPEVVRHFVSLSKKNFSIDTHFYPLGSCTMKYNPKINEWVASMSGFANIHPHQSPQTTQGYLEVFHKLEHDLKQITGMDRFTLQPAAGAHGELTGMMLVQAYHRAKGEVKRNKVLVPDSSHGTNPASAALLGYEVVQIKSDRRERVDLDELKKHLDDQVACLMLTNPNTLGLFEEDILKVTEMVHEAGALLYYDGANMNALLGLARPGDMGFDILHLNLHKTFSTPHGGGGPGAGPVGVKKFLEPFLPGPLVEKQNDRYVWSDPSPQSIGRVGSFYGNAAILLRAYVYIKSHGESGLRQISENAILNANYLKEKLKSLFPVAIDEACMHEFVLTAKAAKAKGIHAIDIGKRLLDYGFHAPTVHFPLVVEDAIMIEPTESESKETLDLFVEAMKKIREELDKNPELIRNAPYTLPIKRPDEVSLARKPILCFRDQQSEARDPVVQNS